VQAIDAGDLPVIIGLVLLATLFVVLASIVTDLCYALLDPMSPRLTARRS
jgi:peptide/nickel transport system permease protein